MIFKINGKTVSISGNTIGRLEIIDGKTFVNGQNINADGKIINITIEGNVGDIQIDC